MTLVINVITMDMWRAYRDITHHFIKHAEVTIYSFLVFEQLYFIHIDSKNQSKPSLLSAEARFALLLFKLITKYLMYGLNCFFNWLCKYSRWI